MKKIAASFLLVLIPTVFITAQDLISINKERQKLQREGMYFLTSWAGLNIAGGTAAFYMTDNKEWKYFHEMNVYWNTVNLGLGISGILLDKKVKTDLNFTESVKAQRKVERIFLINSGLDLLYIGGGFAMKNFHNSNNRDRMLGYGNSLILQGSFLLVFDAVEYFLHRSNGFRYKSFSPKLSIRFDGNSIGLKYALGQ